jgi:hypothetical protein
MQIKNRQHMLAFVAAAGVGLLVADRMVVTPLRDAWRDRTARIVELRKAVTQGAQLRGRERIIRDRWNSMNTNTLPENVSAAENAVLRAFDRWSQDSRISIASIKPQWKQADDDYMTYECRADAFGSLQAITRFLYEIEQDPLALKIESVEINARDNTGQQLSLGLQVSGLRLNSTKP